MRASSTPSPPADAPFQPFHLRVAVAGFGGVFCDGAELGIVGTSLGAATPALGLTPLWLGLLGGASLLGLFLGALVTGPVADRHGRRPIFASNMLLLAAVSVSQYFVGTPLALLVARLSIGVLLGTDYVVSKAMLTEFIPDRYRPRIMGSLAVAWAGGYAAAYSAGYVISQGAPAGGGDLWRLMLLVSAVPCLLIFPLRLAIPESPLWLAARSRALTADGPAGAQATVGIAPLAAVTRPPWRGRTVVACTFFTTTVIPYFAIGTFVTQVLTELKVGGAAAAGLVYNLALLVGAVGGLLTVGRMPRRTYLHATFSLSGGALLLLTVLEHPPAAVSVALFAVFAGVLSASSSLVYVYLPELFPTSLRATGLGLAVASSRIGSAVSTFLLPNVVARWGIHAALGACTAVLLLGWWVCARLAPETGGRALTAVPGHDR
jgi:putative MFS transporter